MFIKLRRLPPNKSKKRVSKVRNTRGRYVDPHKHTIGKTQAKHLHTWMRALSKARKQLTESGRLKGRVLVNQGEVGQELYLLAKEFQKQL